MTFYRNISNVNLQGRSPAATLEEVHKQDKEIKKSQSKKEKDEENELLRKQQASLQNQSAFTRTIQIWAFAVKFAWKYFMIGKKWTYGKEGMTEAAQSRRKTELAKWLVRGLIILGPTFIKIGQQFSCRVDLLDREIIKELEVLQDSVPPFSTKVARQTVEDSFGKKVNEVFEDFEDEPIAAASLGQVHLARYNGQKVVVKVQRPGLKQLFDSDLKNIRVLAKLLNAIDPKTDGTARDWVAIQDECAKILYEEISYIQEAENAKRFEECFKGTPWLKVPSIYSDATREKVLTMEYTPGVKINNVQKLDSMGIDRKLLAKNAVECYLLQLLRYGFFHADPHPGNIAVDSENGGRLIYYDFGMMGTIPGDIMEGLRGLFYGVYRRDPDQCLLALQRMGVLEDSSGGDQTSLRRTAQFFLDQFQESERMKDKGLKPVCQLNLQKEERDKDPETYDSTFKEQMSKQEYEGRRKKVLSSIGEDLLLTAADQPFRFPAVFTFVVRSFTVLDGLGKSLNPRFDMTEIAAPYARSLLLEGKPQFQQLQRYLNKGLKQQNRAIRNFFVQPNRTEDMLNILQRVERGDLKVRTRALEAERQLTRVQTWQKVMTGLVFSSTLVNVGTVLAVSALQTGASISFAFAGISGIMSMANYLKVRGLEKKERQITGQI